MPIRQTSIKHKRKESSFFRAISEIISQELKNSEISTPTVTDVKLSPDGYHLMVYVAFEKNPKKSIEALRRSRGFVRKRLSAVNFRIVPSVDFKIDSTFENAKRIEEIIKKIKNPS